MGSGEEIQNRIITLTAAEKVFKDADIDWILRNPGIVKKRILVVKDILKSSL